MKIFFDPVVPEVNIGTKLTALKGIHEMYNKIDEPWLIVRSQVDFLSILIRFYNHITDISIPYFLRGASENQNHHLDETFDASYQLGLIKNHAVPRKNHMIIWRNGHSLIDFLYSFYIVDLKMQPPSIYCHSSFTQERENIYHSIARNISSYSYVSNIQPPVINNGKQIIVYSDTAAIQGLKRILEGELNAIKVETLTMNHIPEVFGSHGLQPIRDTLNLTVSNRLIIKLKHESSGTILDFISGSFDGNSLPKTDPAKWFSWYILKSQHVRSIA